MRPPTVVEAKHLEKSFGRRRALTDVSFQARRGELVGIVGENGSGKTTLLRILVGLARPTGGTVSIAGRVGYCPQDCLVFDLLTVEENLDYFATAYGVFRSRSGGGPSRHRRWLAQWLGLEECSGRLLSVLSAGTKQKINLAVALLHDPDVLILDEPYSGFDWETYMLFWDYIVDAQSKGKTIIIVSHLIYDESRFDKVLTLKDGILRKNGGQDCAAPM